MAHARPVMCAESRKSMNLLGPPPRNLSARRLQRASMNSSNSSALYAETIATTGYAYDCSKPKKVWPRMLRTVMATAKRRSPPRRLARLPASLAFIDNSLLTTEHDRVPGARRQLNRLLLKRSARVAPAQLYADEFVSSEMAQPELQIGAALT